MIRFAGSAKKKITKAVALVCAAGIFLEGCSGVSMNVDNPTQDNPTEEKTEDVQEAGAKSDISDSVKTWTRKSLLPLENDESELAGLKPAVENIEIADDLSNIINHDEYDYYDKEWLDKIKKNGFVVSDGAGKEFFEIYEMNRYCQTPNFVTVDSMMHTYHIYFAYLMRGIEKDHLYDELKKLTGDMLKASSDQYDTLKGTEWASASERCVAFFSVAALLLDDTAEYPADVKDIVEFEHDHIMSAEGIETSVLTGDYEDYSQYKPRGYYEGDATLEKYFRAMMWYGRRQFDQIDEDADRSALLITLALDKGDRDLWSSIYEVTSFFAGASDDLGYYEYMPAIIDAYGESVDASSIAGDDAGWKKFHALTGKMRAPRINSIPIEDSDDESNVILGYRFMGQRFTIDATIMQELTYRRVGEYEDDDKRLLPDFLDVPAALGSDKAYSILDDMGATAYKNYDKNMETMREEFSGNDCKIWNASLYAGWLNTLRPLLDQKGEGYPAFMRGDEWAKKDLETFAGSYTELKHDTVLYSKQVMAEMGGGWEDDKDFRGYVEPEPLVFSRFETLAKNTAKGLGMLGYLSDADEENLDKLAELAGKLKTISVKELENEKLTDKEYELIEIYGGEIEHFWLDAMKAQTGDEYPSSENYPAALVVDVATDPNGRVLQMATGDPATIYVVVPVDGKLRIAEGSVFSFYQFEQPISDRLTDSEWRKKMGITNESYEDMTPYGKAYDHPDWAYSYRYVYNYD
ncbi:MAG: DUF3160 domain-containing protein [Lachnospiraceae bacterium]|nr:DUF3160 domain-containing protein [Lachnospiraceae bacterium]